MVYKRSLIGTLLISLLVFKEVQTVYENGMNPGMALRIEQQTVDSFKRAMQEFLPNYITHDLKLPTEYHYTLGFLWDWTSWQYSWTDITYSDANFDIKDIKFIMVRQYDQPMLKIDFPALKEWKINAMQTSNSWILPDQSFVELEFSNFDMDFNCNFELEETGFLKPIIYAVDIHFGNSYFYHDNAIVAFVMNQFVEFSIVIIQNTVYFVGTYIFTSMLGPLLTNLLNNYQVDIPFNDFLPGQDSTAMFTIDYRNTRQPFIGEGYMDVYFLGEFLRNGQGCNFEHEPFEFMTGEDISVSQLVITQTAMNCILQQFARSPIGQVDLNEQRWNQLFLLSGYTYMKLDTTSIYNHLPIFQDKLGQNSASQNLRVMMNFDNINCMFGQFDTDVVVEYTLKIGFHVDGPGGQELLYDEIGMVLSADIESVNDIVSVNILNLKPDPAGTHASKTMPVRNTMGMSSNDYREFISTFGFTTNWMKKWLNEVVWKDGLVYPYNTKELNSTLEFQEKSMHILLEVDDSAAKFFEDEFWDTPYY